MSFTKVSSTFSPHALGHRGSVLLDDLVMQPLAMLRTPTALLLLSHALSLGGRHTQHRGGAHVTIGNHHLKQIAKGLAECDTPCQ